MEILNPYINSDHQYTLEVVPCGKYNLEFYILDENSMVPRLYILDKESNEYHYGGIFFPFGWDAEDTKEDLIPTIEDVIERNWGDEILGNNYTLLSAIITPETTYFTSENNLDLGRRIADKNENMKMSTADFREISVKWLEFLESHRRKDARQI